MPKLNPYLPGYPMTQCGALNHKTVKLVLSVWVSINLSHFNTENSAIWWEERGESSTTTAWSWSYLYRDNSKLCYRVGVEGPFQGKTLRAVGSKLAIIGSWLRKSIHWAIVESRSNRVCKSRCRILFRTHQLAYLKTPLMSISNVAAFTKGTFGSMLPLPTSTTLPPGRVDWKEKTTLTLMIP